MVYLCLCTFREQHSVINIVITGNFPAIVSVEFNDFRQIVIDCIKFKILFPAPFNCFRQGFSGTAGSENEFIAIAFPFLEVSNQSCVGLTKFRPFTVAESHIKINGNRFERDSFIFH